jgi:hypothetical protein
MIYYFIGLSIILVIKLCGVIKRNNILEYKYKVAMNNLLTMAKVMGDPRLIEEFEEQVKRIDGNGIL